MTERPSSPAPEQRVLSAVSSVGSIVLVGLTAWQVLDPGAPIAWIRRRRDSVREWRETRASIGRQFSEIEGLPEVEPNE